MTADNKHRGGCLCGAVRYEVIGPMRPVVNCHCSHCRLSHGIHGAYSKAPNDNITLLNESGLTWYDGKPIARRGFCKFCGCHLFWQPYEQQTTAIVAGTLDDSSHLKTIAHIFTDDKAPFYDIHDDLPRYPASSKGEIPDNPDANG